MSIFMYGLSHKTATLATREQFVIASEALSSVLKAMHKHHNVSEVLVLSTCNRLEIYAVDVVSQACLDWLSDYFSLSFEKLEPLLYFYEDEAVITHLLKVACGVDSMIVGEPQILGQLKTAYAAATQARTIGKQLGHLFPFVFEATKKIRNETFINQYPVSVAYAAISLAKNTVPQWKEKTVLLIGAGNTIELIAQYLFDHKVSNMIFANRTRERSDTLAEKFGARSITIREIPAMMPEVDLVFTSTASQLPILGKGLIERIVKQDEGKSLFMVDLAVPRDIEPEVAELKNVSLYNIDDLENTIQENQSDRLLAADKARELISAEVINFKKWQNSLESVPLICAYRDRAEAIRSELMKKALEDLAKGQAAFEVIQDLTRQLTNKLMHEPTVKLREAAYEGDQETLRVAKELLGL
jgi:glutamyl-tRNA reductase